MTIEGADTLLLRKVTLFHSTIAFTEFLYISRDRLVILVRLDSPETILQMITDTVEMTTASSHTLPRYHALY